MVQLLKFQIGAQVTGVCSASKVDYVKALGADHTFDYTSGDFTQIEQRFDVVIDILGKSSFKACRQVLKNEGKCILVSFKARRLLQMCWSRLQGGPQLYCVLGTESPEYLQKWNALLEQGNIHRPASRIFPYTEAVEAHHYAESRHRSGSIVLAFPDARSTRG
jgi:NADPH:quinone reductase-like Zn-dependent oxidoreductase